MDFQHMQERTQALVTLGGWSNVQPPPAYPWLVNEGLRIFSREAQQNREDLNILLVVGQGAYNVITDSTEPTDRRQWIWLADDALWNYQTEGIVGSQPLPQTTEDKLRSQDPAWRNYAPSVPTCWFWSNPHELTLWPTPSQVVLCNWRGARHVAELVSPLDEPAIDETYHEAACLFAAWHWGKLYARGEERAVAQGYQSEAMELVNRFRMSESARETTLSARRVRRAPQEYMSPGSSAVYAYYGSRGGR